MEQSSVSEWGDWEEEETPAQCLFSDQVFPSAQKCWQNAATTFGFDIEALRKEWHLNDYLHIKLVNYLRSLRSEGQDPLKAIPSLDNSKAAPWKDDRYLEPVIPADPLLFIKGWTVHENDSDISDNESSIEEATEDFASLPKEEIISRLLKAEKSARELKEALTAQLQINADLKAFSAQALMDDDQPKPPPSNKIITSSMSKDQFLDAEYNYFEACYGHYSIHSTMLKDQIRTNAYRDFILKNSHLFKDKVVMDVGCGTGILSMFAVESGAKRVIAVDNSSIIVAAKKNAIENGMEDKIIFIKNKVEAVEELDPEGKIDSVDVIISEWMGYGLLFECMLESVLIARDRWCKKGLMFPDVGHMYLQAWSSQDYRNQTSDYFNSVYGYKMTAMREAVLKEARVDILPSAAVADFTDSAPVKHLNMNTVKIEELAFESDFVLSVSHSKPLHGFVLYFDIGFETQCTHLVRFSTGPHVKTTHWEQVVFNLDKVVDLAAGEKITGNFRCKRGNTSHRDLEIEILFEVEGKVKQLLTYTLS